MVELLIVVVILGILATVSYVAIQRVRSKALNEKMLDDLVAIANAMEDYKRDHGLKFPVPDTDEDQNVNCYYADATYAHDCTMGEAAFRQGMIDNNLLSQRYLREVPTDPRTGSRYVYGVTNDGKYFQIAGLYEREDGTYEARTVENLAKGFELPSIIRAYDSANFVTDKDTYLPYSADHLSLTGRLNNVNGIVTVNGTNASDGQVVYQGNTVITVGASTADIYFSDGSVTELDPGTNLVLENMEVSKNDKKGTITKILLKLKAGKIWSKVVRLASESEFRVETTSAIAGVRGTEFSAEFNNTIEVLDGDVWQDTTSSTNEILETKIEADPMYLPNISAKPPKPIHQYIDVGLDPANPGNPPNTNSPAFKKWEKHRDVPLHTGIRPYILSAKVETGTGTVRVRNVNFFMNLLNVKNGWTGEFARRVKANRLVAYKQVIGTDGSITYERRKFSGDILNKQIGAYEITGVPVGTDVYVLRFEYWTLADPTTQTDCVDQGYIWDSNSSKCYEMVEHSSLSHPPLKIETNTNITQEKLYPQLFNKKPYLDITNPRIKTYQSGASGQEIEIKINLGNYAVGKQVDYEIVPDSTSCSLPTVNPNPLSPALVPIAVRLDIIGNGDCKFKIKVKTDKALELEQEVIVEIIEQNQSLSLLYPAPGAQLQPTGSLEFKWAAPNAPAGATYKLLVYHPWPTSITPQTFAPGSNTTHTFTGITAGDDYKWTVEMYDSSGGFLSERSDLFTIMPTTTVDFDTSVTQGGNSLPPPNPSGTIQITNTNDPVDLNLAYNGATLPSGTIYQWSGSINPTVPDATKPYEAFLAIPAPTSSTSSNATVNLTVRDLSQNILGTMTKSFVVSSFPTLTGVKINPTVVPITNNSASPLVVLGGPWPLNMEGEPTVVGSFSPDKCIWSAGVSTNLATNPYQYLVPSPTSGAFTDWIKCTIPQGSTINGHIATAAITKKVYIKALAAAVCGDGLVTNPETCDTGGICSATTSKFCSALVLCGAGEGTCQPIPSDGCTTACQVDTTGGWTCDASEPSICTQSGPPPVTIASVNPVTSTTSPLALGANAEVVIEPGGLPLNQMTCTIESGTHGIAGKLVPNNPSPGKYQYMPVDPSNPNEAARYANNLKETVTIKCHEVGDVTNFATTDVVVEYKPKDQSSHTNYGYSYATQANQTWTQADSFCNLLTEGGVTAGTWGLPSKGKYENTPSYAAAEALIWCDFQTTDCKKIPGAPAMWLDVLGWKVNGYGSFGVVTGSSAYGVRCVK